MSPSPRGIRNPLWRFVHRLVHPRDEWLDVFDDAGLKIGLAPRSLCHSWTFLLHKVSHLIVTDRNGGLLLQKRHPDKDIQPSKWDTSVGGHLLPDERPVAGVIREASEELGLSLEARDVTFLYDYRMRSDREAEWVYTFRHVTARDSFIFDPAEITEVRFWTAEETRDNLGKGVFTPNFEDEFMRFEDWKQHG